MLVNVRTITGVVTSYEVQPSDVVGGLKSNLAAEYDIASLRFCFKGAILNDTLTFEQAGIQNGDSLVVTGKKLATSKAVESAPKPGTSQPAPKPSTAASGPSSAPPPSLPPAQTPAEAAPSATGPPVAPPAVPPAPSASSDAVGVDPALLSQVMEMGFPREECIRALRAAFLNPDRAVDYLINGIPAGVGMDVAPAAARHAPAGHPPAARPPATTTLPPSTAPPTATSTTPSAATGGGSMTAEQLAAMMQQMQQQQQQRQPTLEEALYRIPQFEQIRALVRQNPAAMPSMLTQLQQRHPDVYQIIQQHPEEFLRIVNSGPAAGGAPPAAGGAGGTGTGAPAGAPGGGARQRISLAAQPGDAEAIAELVALGDGMWDESTARIVYIVCRRNREIASNVLLDNGGMPPELMQAIMNAGGVENLEAPGEGEDEDEDQQQHQQ